MSHPHPLDSAVGHAAATSVQNDAMTPMSKRVLLMVFLAWVVDAADSTMYSLTLPQIREEFDLSLPTMGLIASLFLCGSVLGALLIPIIADRRGRRLGMCICISIFSVFTGVVGIAHHAWVVAVGRFFTGTGAGGEWPIGAAYLAEMVPAKKRGFAMGLMQAGYPIGYFLAGGIFALFTWLEFGWRACFLVLVIPVLLCIPIMKWLKESDTWTAGRAPHAQGQATDALGKSAFRLLFSAPYRRYTLIATALHVFGAIFSYGLVVWVPSAIVMDFKMDKMQSAQFVMFAWGVGTLGYLIAGPLADRVGRKLVLSLYTLLGVAAVVWLNVMLRSGVPVAFTDLLLPGVLIGTSLGVAGIYITYTSEIFPAHLRTIGLGFSVSIGKATALFVPTALGLVAQLSNVTTALLIAVGIGVLMIPTILCGPETAGRKLEDIIR
ncbi:MFS transporter [Pseudomonas aeruginosa]|uniref:MFS transporter n=1 Tax=Pseudomonas aeruginosa TaxID=287 RepID=UPI002F90EEB5